MPYDFSIQREIPHGFSVEADYVGTFGRHLLQQNDIAEPLDLVDPKSGMDYFEAAKLLSNRDHMPAPLPCSPSRIGKTCFPISHTAVRAQLRTSTPTFISLNAVTGNESYALASLDAYCDPSEGGLGCGPYEDANGNVTHAVLPTAVLLALCLVFHRQQQLQRTAVDRPQSRQLRPLVQLQLHALESIDMGSDTERDSEFSATNSFSFITNSFNPKSNRAVSDFDTRHLMTGNFIYQLPFGRGMRYGAESNGA